MLFSSLEFIFVFLPLCWLGLWGARRSRAPEIAVLWLLLASAAFYGWWSLRDLLIVALSIFGNFAVGKALTEPASRSWRRLLLTVGIAANLALLGYFKYAGFLFALWDPTVEIASFRFVAATALPLGVSFYTFTQIAYLVDTFRQPVRYQPTRYALFVMIFPHLIAGPILRHHEVIPQFEKLAARLRSPDYFRHWVAPGLALFAVGLAKKTLLADTLGVFADLGFDGVAATGSTDFLSAWAAAATYGLQLYFDFSAYSDMAIAIALLVGVELPINFLSPYRATSPSDFWRRWHISLSRFLREYLYIPLGGNRNGTVRRYVNLAITMLLGGLWHGANWTFVLWGALHGAYLIVEHALREVTAWRPPRWLAVVFTLALVTFAWVLFRAPDLATAAAMYKSMLLIGEVHVPERFAAAVPAVAALLPQASVSAGDSSGLYGLNHIVLILLGLVICWAAPSSMQLCTHARSRVFAMPALAWACGAVAAISVLVIYLRDKQTFLYFQF